MKNSQTSIIESASLLLKRKRKLIKRKQSSLIKTVFKQDSSKTNVKNQEYPDSLNAKTLPNKQSELDENET